MKRFSLLMALLLSFTLGAVAQNVASNATSVDALTDGYYVICAKSNDGKATASYLYAESNKVYYDASGSEKALAGSTIDANTSKYIFYVSKNSDGTLKISLWNDHNTSWPNISSAGAFDYHPGRQDQFTMNSTTGALTATASGDAYILSLPCNYAYYSWGVKYNNCTAYVVLNNSQHVGYYEWQKNSYDNEDAIAKVKFYAVSGTPVNLTYNLKHESNTLYTESHFTFSSSEYPTITTDLNKYYMSAEKPAGTVSADNTAQSFNIELAQQELPFTCGDAAYYYLGTAGENPVMFSHKSGNDIAYRSKAQADTYNNIVKDLWTIRGNVFDGFKFTNVSSGNLVKSSNCIAGNTVTELAANAAEISFYGLADNTNTWDICRGTNGFMIYPHGNESKNRYWSYNGSKVKFNNDNGTIKEFAFYAPEFTFPMYTVGDASYNSIALPFAAQLAEGESTKMYKGKVNGTNLDLTEVSAVPANDGVVLVGPANAETATFVAVKSADAIEDNDLVGTTVAIANADLSDKFIFGVADDDASLVGFFSANSEATLYANHAYILRTTAANVKGLAISFNGTPTGITLPTTNTEADAAAPIYDLSGRRVTNTVKGHLYIKAGRKFIAE